MPLHPAAEPFVKWMADSDMAWYPGIAPATMRDAINRASAAAAEHPVHAVETREIPGPAGTIPVRLYWPSAEPDLPVLVWFHGGGWVTGSIDTHDHLCRMLCDDARAIVVSVDYRLAPETKFPGAIDDCVAAYVWATTFAEEIGGDRHRIAIGGDSAGGNLAAAVALVAREDGLPVPVLQVLVYPITDYEFDSAAMVDNATGYFLERDEMRWFFEQYIGDPEDVNDWRMCPLRAPDLEGLPASVVVTAEYDPLRDQGEAYAQRLRDAAVPTTAARGEGLFHGYFGMHTFMPPAQEAWDVTIGALRAAFEPTAFGPTADRNL